MNYITACPNCGTQFLLNDELIKAYRGKVQCGQCEHVFNAKNRLSEVADDITSAEEYQAGLEDTGSETVVDEIEPVAINENPVVSSHPDTQETTAETTADDPLNNATAVDDDIDPSTVEETSPSQSITQSTEEKPEIEIDHLFNKRYSKHKKPRKYSFLISLINFLLILALILQSLYFLRSDIARQFPALKPLLERACVPLKCTIDLSKNLDLITIGDSDMQEDNTYQSVIKFTSSLKNNANYPQAYPSIELTLTNSDDSPVITKLITPKNYLASKEKIKHGLDPHETASIKLSFYVDDPSVASYRILLLY